MFLLFVFFSDEESQSVANLYILINQYITEVDKGCEAELVFSVFAILVDGSKEKR